MSEIPKGWALFKKKVVLRGGVKRVNYFFVRKPKVGVLVPPAGAERVYKIPAGYKVVKLRGGIPALKKLSPKRKKRK